MASTKIADRQLLTPSGSGNISVIETEIDFGTKPIRSKRFTIINPSVTLTSKIFVLPSGNSATGRGSDDWEWDMIGFSVKAGTGNFTIYAKSDTRIGGKRNIFYTIN